ncbi:MULTISPECIES: hypothetical protein, partial [unclassified Endozoicomonas]
TSRISFTGNSMVCHRHTDWLHKDNATELWLSLGGDGGMAHRSLLSEVGFKPLQAACIKSARGER